MLNVFDLLVVPCATFSFFQKQTLSQCVRNCNLTNKNIPKYTSGYEEEQKKNHIIRLKARMWKNEQDLTFETHLALCKLFIFQLL